MKRLKKLFSLMLLFALTVSLVESGTSKAATLQRPVVKAASTTATKVKLKITKVNRATSYRIYRATSKNGTYKKVATTKSTTFTNTNLIPSKTYYYKVKAVRKNSVSKFSKVVRAKTKASSGTASKTSVQKQMLAEVNRVRKKNGCEALQLSSKINKAAAKRAKEIAKVFSHTRPDGSSCFTIMEEFNITYLACGENIAMGQQTVKKVVNDWMGSEGHRANILSNEFQYLGVGFYNNHWVQLFAA